MVTKRKAPLEEVEAASTLILTIIVKSVGSLASKLVLRVTYLNVNTVVDNSLLVNAKISKLSEKGTFLILSASCLSNSTIVDISVLYWTF